MTSVVEKNVERQRCFGVCWTGFMIKSGSTSRATVVSMTGVYYIARPGITALAIKKRGIRIGTVKKKVQSECRPHFEKRSNTACAGFRNGPQGFESALARTRLRRSRGRFLPMFTALRPQRCLSVSSPSGIYSAPHPNSKCPFYFWRVSASSRASIPIEVAILSGIRAGSARQQLLQQ